MSTWTSEKVKQWVVEVVEAANNFAEAKSEAERYLESMADEASNLRMLFRGRPEGADNACIWDALREASEFGSGSVDLPTLEELSPQEEEELLHACEIVPELSSGMSGADLARYVEAKGGCSDSVDFCRGAADLREAWESCDDPGWLKVWIEWHSYAPEMAERACDVASLGAKLARVAQAAAGDDGSHVYMAVQATVASMMKVALGDDPMAWHATDHCTAKSL